MQSVPGAGGALVRRCGRFKSKPRRGRDSSQSAVYQGFQDVREPRGMSAVRLFSKPRRLGFCLCGLGVRLERIPCEGALTKALSPAPAAFTGRRQATSNKFADCPSSSVSRSPRRPAVSSGLGLGSEWRPNRTSPLMADASPPRSVNERKTGVVQRPEVALRGGPVTAPFTAHTSAHPRYLNMLAGVAEAS